MTKDLVLLVADVQQEKTLETLLNERTGALGIRPINFTIYRHPRKDPGVYREAASFLAPYTPPYFAHALVILDSAWDGAPRDPGELRQTIFARLQATGWSLNCQVIVCHPELESWVWANSPVVPEVLRTNWVSIRSLADKHGYWPADHIKPSHPKDLLEAVLVAQRRPRSSAIFQALAQRVSLERCQDPSFLLLRETLQGWFPSNIRR